MALKRKLLGVYRESLYSHNAIEADRTIIDLALDEIEIRADTGLQIIRIEASELINRVESYDAVLTMAQDQEALNVLHRWEQNGVRVWNTTSAIRACYRDQMTQYLNSSEVSYPTSVLLSTESQLEALPFQANWGFWVKRGDVHAVTDEDVVYAAGLEEVQKTLPKFRERRIEKVVLQAHIPGPVFKFYGVGESYFSCEIADSYVGSHHNLNTLAIGKMAQRAAKLMGLQVYGGDCVLDNRGDIHIIDMNDWPSFRKVRAEAAVAIAKHALSRLLSFENSAAQSSNVSSVVGSWMNPPTLNEQ